MLRLYRLEVLKELMAVNKSKGYVFQVRFLTFTCPWCPLTGLSLDTRWR